VSVRSPLSAPKAYVNMIVLCLIGIHKTTLFMLLDEESLNVGVCLSVIDIDIGKDALFLFLNDVFFGFVTKYVAASLI
jgi:hypothetical protein